MNMTKNGLRYMSIGIAGLCGIMLQPQKVQAYDMDCKVILCIAGGFPAQCGDAYAYMIKRITRWPAPLPPFGFCAMSNGAEYKAHDVNYSFLGQGPQAFDCSDGRKLFYRRIEDSDGNLQGEDAVCYSHTSQVKDTSGDEDVWKTIYHNKSNAQPINFQLSIVIEPGTEQEFKSPLFKIHTGSGYVSQRPL
jgi:hypothetical protein